MSEAQSPAASSGTAGLVGILVIVAGILFMVAGVFTWINVTNHLSAENITVSEDADMFAGSAVNNPWTAYAEAEVINKHALEATGGKTYAELERDDPTRETAMTASFLRASLFTSVVAYGVAFMAFGIGLIFVLIGWALRKVSRPAIVTNTVGSTETY